MKTKTLRLFLLMFLLFGIFHAANATSGACSYHGGVDCAAGAAIDGGAVCNDGTESSVPFTSMQECSLNQTNYCTPPVASGCTSQSQVGGTAVEQNLYGMGSSISGQGAVSGCQDQVNAYNAALQAYESCVASASATSYQTYAPAPSQDTCPYTHGYHSHANASGVCTCDAGYAYPSPNLQMCRDIPPAPITTAAPTCPANSSLNTDGSTCTCSSGFTAIGDSCILTPKVTAAPLTEPGAPVETAVKINTPIKKTVVRSIVVPTASSSTPPVPVTQAITASTSDTQPRRGNKIIGAIFVFFSHFKFW